MRTARAASAGRGFGDAGFYRVQRSDDGIRVWRVARLVDSFHLYVVHDGCVRCDHEIRFLGVRVITLHYRMARADMQPGAHDTPAS